MSSQRRLLACTVSLLLLSSMSLLPPVQAFSSILTNSVQATLPQLYPGLAPALENLGLSTPTPIQAVGATQTLGGENVMFIAPTGSGKTLAYFLPALTQAFSNDSTLLVVAPTRELAIQLARDADSLLDNNNNVDAVHVAVRGLPPPTQADMRTARMLVGTPSEVLTVVSACSRDFVGRIGAVILDEVDVLLPNQPKSMRTALDNKKKAGSSGNSAQDKRRKREQKRKLQAQKRLADTDSKSGAVISPTERILVQVAGSDPQILAGSATASRKTLDTLNRVLRKSRDGMTADVPVVAVRPAADETVQEKEDSGGRSIAVPSEVIHRYMPMTKEEASSTDAVMLAVAKAASILQPKTALVFLCGEFGRPKTKAKTQVMAASKKGKTAQARRNNARKAASKAPTKAAVGAIPSRSISAREVCSKLGAHGIEAQPLHVAMGLEPNLQESTDTPPFLVTFEGSARGLHIDAVDCVFVLGRPVSASSYLHLAGRVGRASTADSGDIINIPGTVVSLCTKGQAVELEKWTKQIGGKSVEELAFTTS